MSRVESISLYLDSDVDSDYHGDRDGAGGAEEGAGMVDDNRDRSSNVVGKEAAQSAHAHKRPPPLRSSRAAGGRTGGKGVAVSVEAQRTATVAYVTVLVMPRLGRSVKLELMCGLMQKESDSSLLCMLEDFLADPKCNLDTLKSILEGAD